MTKRTFAALAALLAFMAVLVAVPLATSEPAEAHTKTVKRCAYDPFSNTSQCWNERVAHVHVPNHYSPPPDTSPRTTTTTTPKKQPPPTTTTTTTTEPPQCPPGQTGTPPNCQTPQCPPGQTGTPPNCQTPQCPPGQTGTPPNCQTPPPPTTAPPTTTTQPPTGCPPGTRGTPPTCIKYECVNDAQIVVPCQPADTTSDCPKILGGYSHLDREQHRHIMGAQRNRGGGTLSACHESSTSHCLSGQHEHVHGSQECHAVGKAVENASGTHSGWTDHCAAGKHSHAHNGSCHAADPPYYEGVKFESAEIKSGYICLITDTKPHGEVKSCAQVPEGSDVNKLIDKALGKASLEERAGDALHGAAIGTTGAVACLLLAGATAGSGGLLCAGVWIAATAIGQVLCLQPWCTKEPSPVFRWNTQNPPAAADDSKDGGSQNQNNGNGNQNEGGKDRPTSASCPDGQMGTPPRCYTPDPRDIYDKAISDYRKGLISPRELREAKARYECQNSGRKDCD